MLNVVGPFAQPSTRKIYVVFGCTADETNAFGELFSDLIKTVPSVVLNSKSRSTAVAELSRPSSDWASDFVVTGTSSQGIPLNAGSPHVTARSGSAVGSPATSVPVFVSRKIE